MSNNNLSFSSLIKSDYYSQIISFKLKRFAIIILICLSMSCASFKAPLYPNIIYNNRQPLISVSYEYGEIQLIQPLKYDGIVPDNIMFKIFSGNDTVNPVISILQESPKQFVAFLPQGVLDTVKNTNYINIIPQDSNFDSISVRFKGINFGRIVLPQKDIRSGQLIVSGTTSLLMNNNLLEGVELSVQNYDNLIYKTRSNKNGFYKIAIPGEYKFTENLRLVAGENLIFTPITKKLNFHKRRKINIDLLLGPSESMLEPLYMTNKNNVHFRDGPDIGSNTLFLLQEGEIISVDRVTPGEYFGTIEVIIDDGSSVKMEGWINRKDLRLVNMKNIYAIPTN